MPRFDEIELEPVTFGAAPVATSASLPVEIDRDASAPLARRALALLIDLSLFAALAIALSPLLPSTLSRLTLAALGGFVMVVSFYYFVVAWMLWGRTIGGGPFQLRTAPPHQRRQWSGEEAVETHRPAGRAVAQRFRGGARVGFEAEAGPGLECRGGEAEGVERGVVIVSEELKDGDGGTERRRAEVHRQERDVLRPDRNGRRADQDAGVRRHDEPRRRGERTGRVANQLDRQVSPAPHFLCECPGRRCGAPGGPPPGAHRHRAR